MREIIHNNMALGKEEFLSDSFSSFNYLVGKPNTQLVVSVRQKQSVSEEASERVWNYSKQNTLIVRRELKVSCFSSKTKHSKLYHSETKKVVKLVGLSKMRCNLFLTSKGNDKPSKQIHTNTHKRNDVSHCFTDSLTHIHPKTHKHTHSKQCKSMRERARVFCVIMRKC